MTTINLNKKDFTKVLNIGGTFAGHSKVLPILDCVKIKVSNGYLTIVSSDSENAISKKMKIEEADGEVTFCVSFKDLSSYVKLVSGDIVTLVVNEKELEVKHEKGNVTLPLMDAEEFPALKPDADCTEVKINSALLNNWIVDAKNFVGDGELRPVMGNIYFYSKDGEVGCCGSDGQFMFSDNIKEDNGEWSFLLNRGAFKSVCDVCQDVEEVTVKIGSKNVMFVGDGVSVLARLQEGRFPNFKSVIPVNNPIQVKLSKSELLDAINRVKVGANNASCLIKIAVKGFNMQVSAQDIDFNRKAVENIMVEANGNITIGFNANKFITCLNAIATDNVVMNMSDASRACVINEDDENSNKIALLMPMLLQD